MVDAGRPTDSTDMVCRTTPLAPFAPRASKHWISVVGLCF
jgi:hypothetical protein